VSDWLRPGQLLDIHCGFSSLFVPEIPDLRAVATRFTSRKMPKNEVMFAPH
jgi:hypothetical protein